MFIFSVIAALAALCALFPDGERHIAGLDIRFPSLHEMLAGEETEDIRLSPEELIAQPSRKRRKTVSRSSSSPTRHASTFLTGIRNISIPCSRPLRGHRKKG